MSKKSPKPAVPQAPDEAAVPVSGEVAMKRRQLEHKLYALAGDPEKADEFEAVRLELEALGQ